MHALAVLPLYTLIKYLSSSKSKVTTESMSDMVVIVISDDPQFVYLMQSYILRSGYRMHVAPQGGVDLLSFIRQENPGVILLDADSIGNTEALDSLRSSDVSPKPPIVVCSWIDSTGPDSKSCFHLNKPVIYGDFQQVLAQSALVGRDNQEAPM